MDPLQAVVPPYANSGNKKEFNKKVYLDITIGDDFQGRLVIELYNDLTPLAAENFRALCTGEKGNPLHYKGSKFHHIVPGFICVGGDITAGDGSGGRESIYGTSFRDKCFPRPHIEGGRGFLSFVNFGGPDAIGSQFIICLGNGHVLDLDGFLVFGEIVEGEEVLYLMESTGYQGQGKTVIISDCGELPNYPRVFFDITVDDAPAGRVIMELYTDTNPSVAENFRLLCTGEKEEKEEGSPLHYKGSTLYRVIPNYGLIGGDILCGNGSGGTSCFEERFFTSDNYVRKHKGPGTLSMVNCGEDGLPVFGSQFMISTGDGPMEWLDGKQVVFGHAVDGWSVVKAIETLGHPSSRPCRNIRIANSGQIGPDGSPNADCCSSPTTHKEKRSRLY